MIKIELDVFERKDLLTYLKYALEKKEKDKKSRKYNGEYGKKFDTTTYDIMRIQQLINQIENPRSRVSIYKSTTYDYCRARNSQDKKEENNMEGLIEIL